jgi:acetylornithine/N-succinyldiaminopimelate aminotransferase
MTLIAERIMSHLMNNYARQAVAFTHGEGCQLFDEQGRRYLDGLAGIAVNTLGHNHPRLVAALTAQLGRMIHVSNLYRVVEQEKLADRLAGLSGMDEVFFCNSGCEANEAAIKLARLYGHQKNIDNPAIIVMEHAFKVQAGFEPLVPGFVRVPFDDLVAIEQVASINHNVVAVLFEPLQGEGGIHIAHDEFMVGLRHICDERGWLFMVDEVQCGIGRTGKWFAHQHAGIKADVMTLAKGLGSGVPVGACLTAGAATGVFKPGNHGSTFGGNPLACVAALTTLDVIEEGQLMAHAVTLGERIRSNIREALAGVAGLVGIRGHGLMIGIELDRPCAALVAAALDSGLIINVTADTVVRLLPPLILTEAEADELVVTLVKVIKRFLAA